MGYVDVSGVRHTLPDGRVLLDDVNFRVGDGVRAALVGENGAARTPSPIRKFTSSSSTRPSGSVCRTPVTST